MGDKQKNNDNEQNLCPFGYEYCCVMCDWLKYYGYCRLAYDTGFDLEQWEKEREKKEKI